jgi:hypothetical protein
MRSLLLLLPIMAIACSGSDDTDATDGSGDDDDVVGDDDDDTPGDDDDDDDVVYTGCLAGGIAVEPGTGVEEYVPLNAGDDVVMVHGPQGGWHIDVGGLVTNTEQLVSIDAVFVDTDSGVQVAGEQTEVRQALVDWDASGCTGEFYSVRVFVDDFEDNVGQADICALEGASLDMTLTVTALEATPPAVATVTIPVVAVLDPADVPVCAGTSM